MNETEQKDNYLSEVAGMHKHAPKRMRLIKNLFIESYYPLRLPATSMPPLYKLLAEKTWDSNLRSISFNGLNGRLFPKPPPDGDAIATRAFEITRSE